MEHDTLHPWDVPTDRARELQLELGERLVLEAPSDFEPRLVAGADLSIVHGRDRGHAALVVVDRRSMETVEVATASVDVEFPYVPGLLSFREIPALAAAWRKLRTAPDVFVSPGHRMDIETGIRIVLSVTPRFRLPEPIRRAHRRANETRKEATGG